MKERENYMFCSDCGYAFTQSLIPLFVCVKNAP